MPRARFWRREPTFEVCPGDFVPTAPAPRQPDPQRRDRGASHHGELAAQRPGAPDPGLGQEASALGTHLGRAAQAGGGEGGRRSRHVAISDVLRAFLPPGDWGEGARGQGKLSFKSLSASRNFLWPGSDGCQLSEARVWGDVCSGSRRLEGRGGSLPSCWEDGAVACAPLVPLAGAPIAGALAREPAGCAPSVPARPSHPRAPARAASLSPPRSRWRGGRGLHKGRRGLQVGRAPGGGQAPESESDRVQLRATPAWTVRGAGPEGLCSPEAKYTPHPYPYPCPCPRAR